jgi:2-methylcitrate dehydratase
MTTCEQLADWATSANFKRIHSAPRHRIKLHLLDAIGCALGALHAEPIQSIRREESSANASGPCTLIGGGRSTPERAAFFNGALVRYLDFMDTFVAPHEACHPSDNIAVLLAAAELTNASGADLLTAILVAYHVQVRLTGSGVPIMQSGFDHTVQLAISQTAGLARLLNLSREQAAHAIAISTASCLGLAGSRAGNPVPQWKGLASAATAFSTIHNTRLAQQGITGPLDIFESPLGLEHILGHRFSINWRRERYNGVLACSLKRYNAEFHAQTAIEAILDLRHSHTFALADVHGIHIDIFRVAYEMIGGGKYVDPKSVTTKEDADHSLHYLAAVALLDGRVGPDQFESARLRSDDVQSLLRRVSVSPSRWYTRAYPKSMTAKVTIKLRDGRKLVSKASNFSGFYRTPMPEADVIAKFESLASRACSHATMKQLEDCILNLDRRPASDLIDALRSINSPGALHTAA